MIPWLYHRLTPRDQAGDLLRIVNFTQQRTGAGTIIQYRVPDEKLLLITAANWYWEDLAGTVAQPWQFVITQDTTTVLNFPMVRDVTQVVGGGTQAASVHRSGSPWLMVPPGHVINSIILGGLVTSQHIFSFNGILIPHGTFSE